MPALPDDRPAAPPPSCARCRGPCKPEDGGPCHVWGFEICLGCFCDLKTEGPTSGEVEASAPPADVERVVTHEWLPGKSIFLKPGAFERLYVAWLRGWFARHQQRAA